MFTFQTMYQDWFYWELKHDCNVHVSYNVSRLVLFGIEVQLQCPHFKQFYLELKYNCNADISNNVSGLFLLGIEVQMQCPHLLRCIKICFIWN